MKSFALNLKRQKRDTPATTATTTTTTPIPTYASTPTNTPTTSIDDSTSCDQSEQQPSTTPDPSLFVLLSDTNILKVEEEELLVADDEKDALQVEEEEEEQEYNPSLETVKVTKWIQQFGFSPSTFQNQIPDIINSLINNAIDQVDSFVQQEDPLNAEKVSHTVHTLIYHAIICHFYINLSTAL